MTTDELSPTRFLNRRQRWLDRMSRRRFHRRFVELWRRGSGVAVYPFDDVHPRADASPFSDPQWIADHEIAIQDDDA